MIQRSGHDGHDWRHTSFFGSLMSSYNPNRRPMMKNKKNKKRKSTIVAHTPSYEMQILKETMGNVPSTEPRFHCTLCRKPILGTPHEFGGDGLACESCIRAHYNGYPESSIAEELRCRGYGALRIIKQQHSRRRKSTALRNNAMCDVCGGNHQTENCPDDF